MNTLSEPARRSPRLAKLVPHLRRSDRIAQAKAIARAEQDERAYRRSDPIAQAKAIARAEQDERAYRRSDRIAQAKAAAQAEQAVRAETAAARAEAPLRRSVRINKPSDDNTVLRWQAFLKEIQAENTIEDSDYEDCDNDRDSEYDDYDYEVYKN